jgi:predicted acylesterase/phospholipase RssA
MARLNIALTLPGGASLGTFEAGAVSALLVALQRINELDPEAVAVDGIAGASAGSLTAVLVAGVLLTGSDPVAPLRQAWVSEPSLAALQGHDLQAPLSLDRARKAGHQLLADMLLPDAVSDESKRRAQATPVKLEFALTSLRGFNYEICQRPRAAEPPAAECETPVRALAGEDDQVEGEDDQVEGEDDQVEGEDDQVEGEDDQVEGEDDQVKSKKPRTIQATRYIDWAQHEFEPDDLTGLTENWSAAVDSAIASASLPLVFPPVLLNRSAKDDARSVKRGVTNLPKLAENVPAPGPPATLWYSDGGLVDREPLGRCLRLVRGPGSPDESRLVLVIRPHPELAPAADDKAWTGDMEPPRWRATLARALRVTMTHSLYEDLRSVEKTNSQIAWIDSLVDALWVEPKDIKAAHLKLAGPQDGDAQAAEAPQQPAETQPAEADQVTEVTKLIKELQEAQKAKVARVMEQIRKDNASLRHATADIASQTLETTKDGKKVLRQALPAAAGLEVKQPVATEDDTEDGKKVLKHALRAAAGLDAKQPVAVEVVSPPDPSEVSGAAVGFVSERLRATSFLVGYEAMLLWIENGLEEYGIPPGYAKDAKEAARERAATIPGWIGEIPIGRWPPRRLSAGLLRIGVRAARVGLANPRARDRK